MVEPLTIGARFNGPPRSANGGYASGRVAALLEAETVEVTLRAPPPLDVPLEVRHVGDGLRVERDGLLLAEARAAALAFDVPDPVSFPDAVEAARGYAGFREHAYPTCFACGPDRAEGDGLRIFVGSVARRSVGAAPWVIADAVAGANGSVDHAVMWAALDCPSYWGAEAVAPTGEPVLLGRLVARVHRAARAGERCVSMGWPLGRDGRKIYAGAAVFTADGELLGVSRATWIVVDG